MINHVSHVFDLYRHVYDLFLSELEAAYGLAKLHALGCIPCRFLICRLCHADIHCGGHKALDLEVFHQLEEASALLADKRALIQNNVLKIHLAGVDHMLADLIQRSDLHAGCVHRQPVHAHILLGNFVFIISCHQEHIRHSVGVGDKGLLSVYIDLTVSVLRTGRHGGVVTAGIGLCEAERERFRAGHRILHGLCLLLRAAECEHIIDLACKVHPAQIGEAKCAGLLDHHALCQYINLGAAVLLGDAESCKAGVDHNIDCLLRELVLLVALLKICVKVISFVYFFQAFKQQFLIFCFLKFVHIVSPFLILFFRIFAYCLCIDNNLLKCYFSYVVVNPLNANAYVCTGRRQSEN